MTGAEGGMTGACYGVWCGVLGGRVIVCGVSRRVIGMRMFGSCLMVPAAWNGVRGCCCMYIRVWYRYSVPLSYNLDYG